MASCRLCKATDPKRTTHMFSVKGLRNKWASRIPTLLHVTVDEDDQLPPHVCNMCTRRLESLEKATADLRHFKS